MMGKQKYSLVVLGYFKHVKPFYLQVSDLNADDWYIFFWQNPLKEITRIAQHIGAQDNDELLQQVVKATAFNSMKLTKQASEKHLEIVFKGTMYRKGVSSGMPIHKVWRCDSFKYGQKRSVFEVYIKTKKRSVFRPKRCINSLNEEFVAVCSETCKNQPPECNLMVCFEALADNTQNCKKCRYFPFFHTLFNFCHNYDGFLTFLYTGNDFHIDILRKIFAVLYVVCKGLTVGMNLSLF